MAKRKVCVQDRVFVEGDECPICKMSQFSTTWSGRMFILDVQHSQIAHKIDIKDVGEYAIKVK
ncbi:DNA-directed RNA polymerase subunit E'' [Candidatus Woesearchaeota archaeon]|nr:DNA-directed RNA polymerase subunit E'' [Candidatus Woesearchaeota archaeon]